MRRKRLDILVLLILMVMGIFYGAFMNKYLSGKPIIAAAAYIIPSIMYLSLRRKKNWPKVLTATLIFGGLFGFIFEFLAELNKAYSVIYPFAPRVLGIVSLDNIFVHMMMSMLTIVFYEHFVDREVNHHISKHIKYAVLPGIFACGMMLILYFLNPAILLSRYPYLYMGLAAIIPPIYLGITRPRFIKNMALTAIYFFFFYFAIEFVAVNQRWWIYAGNNYIGWIKLFNTEFPFEELFFWMMFYAATIVSYYELFIDDHGIVKRKRK